MKPKYTSGMCRSVLKGYEEGRLFNMFFFQKINPTGQDVTTTNNNRRGEEQKYTNAMLELLFKKIVRCVRA